MKKMKSHFWYNKNQRNGIFSLLILIVLFQIIYVTVDFSKGNKINTSLDELARFEKQYDSLKKLQLKKKKLQIYPFNPNYINDYKGYQLGMSIKEIDRLQLYRKKGRFVNSKKEFQQVTKVSDSLLNKIAPYFKFPDWVVKRNQQRKNREVKKGVNNTNTYNFKNRKPTTIDINKAIVSDFQTIKGVGKQLSERIVKYRDKLQGYTYNDQLFEVWKLEKELAQKILTVFKVIEKPIIKKININTATFKEVLKIPYIDYELCKKLFEYRDEVAELQNIEELKNIEGFPLEKYSRIVLYLLAQ
ncbi:MAG: helix-hairpin-helix domain-containing protein [Flavobacteriaceae bacterium]